MWKYADNQDVGSEAATHLKSCLLYTSLQSNTTYEYAVSAEKDEAHYGETKTYTTQTFGKSESRRAARHFGTVLGKELSDTGAAQPAPVEDAVAALATMPLSLIHI